MSIINTHIIHSIIYMIISEPGKLVGTTLMLSFIQPFAQPRIKKTLGGLENKRMVNFLYPFSLVTHPYSPSQTEILIPVPSNIFGDLSSLILP